jgi:ferredoxin
MSRRAAWWLDVLRIYWPLNHLIARATGLPVIGRILTILTKPLFGKKHFNISYIPVNVKIESEGSMVLAEKIIEELIYRSAHRVIINRCSCRDSKKCKTYPIDDSCLLLGEDTRVIDPRISRHVSVEEAIDHLRQKISIGLIPMTGRVRLDDLYYGVPNRKRMLTICFCCPCCCTILNSAKFFPEEIRSSLVRMKNTAVKVDGGKCKKCGTCVDACFTKAISSVDGSILRMNDKCIGCGRCVTVCPEKAAVISIDNLNESVNELMERIAERVSVE